MSTEKSACKNHKRQISCVLFLIILIREKEAKGPNEKKKKKQPLNGKRKKVFHLQNQSNIME